MLANLKGSANFTLIQCIKVVSRFFGQRYFGDDFFQGRDILGTIFNIHNRKQFQITAHPIYCRFIHVLVFGVSFQVMKFKPLVIWIWNQNIAISTIVRTSSHIILFNPFSFLVPKRLLDYLVLQVFDIELTWRKLFPIRFMCTCLGIYVFTLNVI